MNANKNVVNQLNCLHCGAPIKPEWGEQVVTCPYCLSVQHIAIDWKESKKEEPQLFSVHQDPPNASTGEFLSERVVPSVSKPTPQEGLPRILKTAFRILFFLIFFIIVIRILIMMLSGPFVGGYFGF